MTGYDSKTDNRPFSDGFGELKATLKIWGEVDDSGNIKDTYFKPLNIEKCKEEDINLDGAGNNEDFNFYEPSEEYKRDVERKFNDLYCIRDDALL